MTFELFDEGTIQFSYSEFGGRDDYGKFYGVVLESLENTTDLNTCDFRYITYDARESLNRI